MKNKFIVFEGIDGAGKSTLAKMISERLNYKYLTSIPDFLSASLSEVSKTNSPISTFHYFSLCNTIRSFEINKILTEKNVVLDRYIFSTFAYHRLLLGEEIETDIQLYKKSTSSILLPDCIFFITASRDVIKNRISMRETEKPQKQWYGDKVSLSLDVESSYKIIFEKFGTQFIHIDTSNITPDEGFKIIIDNLNKNFK